MSTTQPEKYTEADAIADQLERAFEGDAWSGPTITEILTGISAAQAAARPLPAVHSIWEIVRHTAAWQRTVRERLQGKPVTPLPDTENWPEISEPTETEWAKTIEELRTEYELLRAEAIAWRDRNLSVTLEGERYTAYQMFHGVIQHIYYHAGQIAILKKADYGDLQ